MLNANSSNKRSNHNEDMFVRLLRVFLLLGDGTPVFLRSSSIYAFSSFI